jgi:H+/Cl- antiporter ClcA
LLSAGIFSSETSSNNIYTSALWWLFVATTVPLTLIVMGAWWMYRRHAERAKQKAPESEPELKHQASWPGKIAFDTASLFRRRKSSVMNSNT